MSSHSADQPLPPDRLAVARVLGVWGRRGHVKIESLSDIPDRFANGARFFIGEQAYVSEGSRQQGKTLIIKLQGVDNRSAAAELQGAILEAPFNEAPALPGGTYFHHQIIGLEVWTSDGRVLGKVTAIISTGSNDVYVVQGPDGEMLIPATTDVVSQVDMEAGRITVEAIPGLL